MSRVIKSLGVKLQPSALCADCDQTWRESATTRESAKLHAASSGHTVEVVTRVIDQYRQEKRS